jgi:hypothetical protein
MSALRALADPGDSETDARPDISKIPSAGSSRNSAHLPIHSLSDLTKKHRSKKPLGQEALGDSLMFFGALSITQRNSVVEER